MPLQDLMTGLKQITDIVRTNYYSVEISPNGYINLTNKEFVAINIKAPDHTITHKKLTRMGRVIYLPRSINTDLFSITFYDAILNAGTLRSQFIKWQNEHTHLQDDLKIQDSDGTLTLSDIKIKSQDMSETIINTWELTKCFPISISGVTHSANENNLSTFSVAFSFIDMKYT